MNAAIARRRATFFLLAALAAYVSVGAAQAPPASPQSPAPQRPAETPVVVDQKPTFQVQVNYVSTDVIARNNQGQFVSNLTKDDLEVYEDGVRQDIAAFTLVHGGRVINLQAPPPPPVEEGIILPAARPRTDAAGRIFLLFVDDLHLNFRDTPRIRDLFKRISNSLIHDGDMFGIVSTGPNSLAIDLTYDRKRLDEAIKKISGSGLKPSDIIGGPEGAEGPTEVRYRAHVAFSTAYEILSNLEKVQNRRKAVIYVSNGYDLNPFQVSRYGGGIFGGYGSGVIPDNDSDSEIDPWATSASRNRQTAQFADADLARQMADLTRAANRANATIYTIDPRGLVGGADLDEQVDPTEWNDYVRKSQDSLRVIADLTGGTAVVNQNDFDRALKRIDAETSDYYMLGYYSSNPDPTRRTRRVEVKTKREGVEVWARSSYTLKRPGAK
ncbi:MAG: VWA domain-containing protein [Vicinamibacterales bacterium]|nr:VWA domain-containing protein [Vicinamibacterales bacterium]